MPLPAGTRLGSYEVIAPLGEGGMGEVYRARDTRLGRDVAIKVLPASVSDNPDRLRRFEQEARATGALNHPNVLVVHDIGHHDGSPYVVCELLEGTTLREQLSGTPLPARKAIDYAIQVARGLGAAHERGIVHRDLKPENLFVTRDGRVKILDFGIAKLIEEGDDAARAEAPTKHAATESGVVIGTVGYMSPEQVRGQRVDQRSDIFSFGTVLYEMLSGRRAFRRDSSVETLNAILTDDPPDLPTTNSGVVPALERVVRHCLEKSPEQRFQSARDVAFALEGVAGHSGSTPVTVGTPAKARALRTRLAWVAAALFMLTTAALAIMYVRRDQPETHPVRFEIPAPEGGTFQGTGVSSVISPDGQTLAMAVTTESGPRLFVRALGSTVPRRLDGTEGASNPFWSPDSRSIGFFAEGKLRKVGVTGGSPQTICCVASLNTSAGPIGTWGDDDTILFSSWDSGNLFKVRAIGGERVVVATPQRPREGAFLWPYFLPDGRHFLYYSLNSGVPSEVRIGSLDSKETKLVMQANTRAVYAAAGYLLFVREGILMAQRFDLSTMSPTGERITVAEDLLYLKDIGQADFSVSNNGVLAYQAGTTASRLVWYSRNGTEVGQVGDPAHFLFPRLSRDGWKVAVDILDRRAGTTDIWLFDLARDGQSSRVTNDAFADWTPVLSPDGKQLAFASNRAGPPHVHVKGLSDSGSGEQLVQPTDAVQFVSDWGQDAEGAFIIYQDGTPQTRSDLMLVRLSGERKPRAIVRTPSDETDGVASPDGKWLAYVSTDSGRNEVYVRAFDGSGERLKVSTAGGLSPRWKSDGKELYYLATASTMPFGATVGDGRLMAVSVGVGGRPGIPTPLFSVRALGSQYDTKDGQRFLVNTGKGSATLPITVSMNWMAELRR